MSALTDVSGGMAAVVRAVRVAAGSTYRPQFVDGLLAISGMETSFVWVAAQGDQATFNSKGPGCYAVRLPVGLEPGDGKWSMRAWSVKAIQNALLRTDAVNASSGIPYFSKTLLASSAGGSIVSDVFEALLDAGEEAMPAIHQFSLGPNQMNLMGSRFKWKGWPTTFNEIWNRYYIQDGPMYASSLAQISQTGLNQGPASYSDADMITWLNKQVGMDRNKEFLGARYYYGSAPYGRGGVKKQLFLVQSVR